MNLLAVVAAALLPAAASQPSTLNWDDALSLKSAPRRVHFRARFQDGEHRSHELEVWREGDARIRRQTDGKLNLLAVRERGDVVLKMFDLERKVLVDLGKNLDGRPGAFADWDGLSQVLVRPRASYQLVPAARPLHRGRTGRCSWYRVEQPGSAPQEICWSTRWAMPLLVEEVASNGERVATFAVLKAEERADPSAFVLRAAAFARGQFEGEED